MIHDDDPFAVPVEERDPVRRFRGRIPAPVTVVTSGSGPGATGLTVSSLMVADGDPGTVEFLCGRNADLGDAIVATGGFVVHVLRRGDEALSDRFAGIRPSPGGLFAGLDVTPGRWGLVIVSLQTRAECRLLESRDAGWYLAITGSVEDLVLGDDRDPLLRYRGHYRLMGED